MQSLLSGRTGSAFRIQLTSRPTIERVGATRGEGSNTGGMVRVSFDARLALKVAPAAPGSIDIYGTSQASAFELGGDLVANKLLTEKLRPMIEVRSEYPGKDLPLPAGSVLPEALVQAINSRVGQVTFRVSYEVPESSLPQLASSHPASLVLLPQRRTPAGEAAARSLAITPSAPTARLSSIAGNQPKGLDTLDVVLNNAPDPITDMLSAASRGRLQFGNYHIPGQRNPLLPFIDPQLMQEWEKLRLRFGVSMPLAAWGPFKIALQLLGFRVNNPTPGEPPRIVKDGRVVDAPLGNGNSIELPLALARIVERAQANHNNFLPTGAREQLDSLLVVLDHFSQDTPLKRLRPQLDRFRNEHLDNFKDGRPIQREDAIALLQLLIAFADPGALDSKP